MHQLTSPVTPPQNTPPPQHHQQQPPPPPPPPPSSSSSLTMSHSPLPLPVLPPLNIPNASSLPTPIHPPVSPPSRLPLSRFTSPTFTSPPPPPPLLLPDDVTFTSPQSTHQFRPRPRLPALSPSPRLPSALPPSASPRVLASPQIPHLPYFNSTDLTPPPPQHPPLPSPSPSSITPRKRLFYRSPQNTVDETEADTLFSTLPVKRQRRLPSPSELMSSLRNNPQQPQQSSQQITLTLPPTSPSTLTTSSNKHSSSSPYPFSHVPLNIPPGVVTGRHTSKPPRNPVTAPGYNNVSKRSPGLLTAALAGCGSTPTTSSGTSVGVASASPGVVNVRPNTTGGSGVNVNGSLERFVGAGREDAAAAQVVVTRHVDCENVRRQGYGEFVGGKERALRNGEQGLRSGEQVQYKEVQYRYKESGGNGGGQLNRRNDEVVGDRGGGGNNGTVGGNCRQLQCASDTQTQSSSQQTPPRVYQKEDSMPQRKQEDMSLPIPSKAEPVMVSTASAQQLSPEEEKKALQRLGEVAHDPLLCGVCGARFARKSNRLKHVRSVHSTERRFKCQICSYAFKRQDHLHKHIASVHEKRRNFKCNICSACFAEKFNLKKHIKTVHFKGSSLPTMLLNRRTAMAMKFIVRPQ